jgi:hypothetical protein
MMKQSILILIAIIAMAISAKAQNPYGSSYGLSSSVNTSSIHVNGYTKSDGTYVQGHQRSTRNSTNHDNYSTSGNVNPYTGTTGSRAMDYSSSAYNYGAGHTIHTGSRGGQYYINSHGNKTYVPKRR